MPKEVRTALYDALMNDVKPRDYTRVHCPALVIHAEHYYLPETAAQAAYEENHWSVFQRRSLDRVRRELTGVRLSACRSLAQWLSRHVPAAREKEMKRFLTAERAL